MFQILSFPRSRPRTRKKYLLGLPTGPVLAFFAAGPLTFSAASVMRLLRLRILSRPERGPADPVAATLCDLSMSGFHLFTVSGYPNRHSASIDNKFVRESNRP